MTATTVKDLQREARMNAKKFIRLYNPTKYDFKIAYHNGKKHKIIVLDALEITKLPYNEARHAKKHLINHLLGGKYPTKPRLDKILKRIEVKL